MELNTILIVVDPTADRQPAFERGLDTAWDTGARLHLYACASESSGFSDLEEARAKIQPRLDELAGRASRDGYEVSSELEWATDWAPQIVSAANRIDASMILKHSLDHRSVDREKRTTSDWVLLRSAPCPVLLVKDFHDWSHRRILAAVNPAATEGAHVRLNEQITSLAQRLSTLHGSDAHFVTAFQNMNKVPDAGKYAGEWGIGTEHVHMRKGSPADVIRDVASELEVDLVIVGTVARDGIKGRVVGNTCERLLDQTHSDLLVLNQ